MQTNTPAPRGPPQHRAIRRGVRPGEAAAAAAGGRGRSFRRALHEAGKTVSDKPAPAPVCQKTDSGRPTAGSALLALRRDRIVETNALR